MKKLIALILTVMMMLTAVSALAETTITVSGTGETRVSADTAVISLGVNARDRDVQKAQQKANESIAAIRNALIALGVEEENISTEHINIYAVYDYRDDREELTAYNAGSTLAVKVTEIDRVGALIDAAFSAGANTLNGISFSASDTEEAKTESLKRAVEDARKKAEILAKASGLEIDGIGVISENGVFSYENSAGNAYAKGMGLAEEEMDAGTVVQAAKLIVSASVSITFTAEEAYTGGTDGFREAVKTDKPGGMDEWEGPDEFGDADEAEEPDGYRKAAKKGKPGRMDEWEEPDEFGDADETEEPDGYMDAAETDGPGKIEDGEEPDEFEDGEEPDDSDDGEEPDEPDDAADIAEEYLVGGWSIAEDSTITDEIMELFRKGTEGLLGVDYVPVAYLGSQLVAGVNHAILCRATTVYPDAQPRWVIMYLYEDLEGNVSVTEIADL